METNRQPTASFELTPLTPEQHPVSALPKRTTELPFFYLTKKKELLNRPIHYESVDESGHPIRWQVTPNTIIGAPGIDAHEIWVRLIVPAMEHHRTADGKIPELLPLGGVRKCLRMIGWSEGGRQARQLLRGLNRIASAFCEASFFLPTLDTGGQVKLVPVKGKFSRLSIYAIGDKHVTNEQLADGKFDFSFDLDATIYLQLHNIERAIQENQERRYIDNQYMFSVEPTGRRWLEIMAAKIFGVVKNNGTHCEVRYSWYVKQHHTLQRQSSRYRVTDQMNQVVEDHIASGYILKPEYRTVKEPGREIDFIIQYKPGPMAHQSTSRIRANLKSPAGQGPAGESRQRRPRQQRLHLAPVTGPQTARVIDLVAELANRGVGDSDARSLLATLSPDQPVLNQLEYLDFEIRRKHGSRGEIKNAPGFYIDRLRANIRVPPAFETSQARIDREEAEFAKAEAIRKEREDALAAEEAESSALQAKIDQLPEADRLALLAETKAEQIAKTPQMKFWLNTHPEATSYLLACARLKLKSVSRN